MARSVPLLLVAALALLPFASLKPAVPAAPDCTAGEHQPAQEHGPCPDCAQDHCGLMPSCSSLSPALAAADGSTPLGPATALPVAVTADAARTTALQPPTPPPQVS